MATAAERREVRTRVASAAASRVLSTESLAPIAAGVSVVLAAGAVEGATHLAPRNGATPSASSAVTRGRFLLRFAAAQVLPSAIWGTQPAEAVAAAMEFRRPGSAPRLVTANPSAADVVLLRGRLAALRGVVAGTVVLSQVLALTNSIERAGDEYRARCDAGAEPPLRATAGSDTRDADSGGTTGVVIRLAGRDSDVTALGLDRMGRAGLFPVFEDPRRSSVRHLVRRHGGSTGVAAFNDGRSSGKWWSWWERLSGSQTSVRVPVYWQVPDGRYGKRSSWAGLGPALPKKWLFVNPQGRSAAEVPLRVLVLEGDATAGEAAFGMASSAAEGDLDLQEASQGFARLAELAPPVSPGEQPVEVLRVLLADANATVESGGGTKQTVRERVRELRLADVLVDSRRPLIREMEKWVHRTVSTEEVGQAPTPVRVCLETPSRQWFDAIKAALARENIEVVSRTSGLPLLVYQRNTADTINTIDRLIGEGLVAPSDVCALLDSHEGLEELREMIKADQRRGIGVICSSVIFDELLAKVRRKATREGWTWEQIQRALDEERL
jgi:Family of unknown function (DUF6739)